MIETVKKRKNKIFMPVADDNRKEKHIRTLHGDPMLDNLSNN